MYERPGIFLGVEGLTLNWNAGLNLYEEAGEGVWIVKRRGNGMKDVHLPLSGKQKSFTLQGLDYEKWFLLVQ